MQEYLLVLGLAGGGLLLVRRFVSQKPSPAAPLASGADPLIGSYLGGYRLKEPLGEGGMARVYLALPAKSTQPVALKVILPHQQCEEFQQRFEREIQICLALNHPNVLRMLDWGREGPLQYLVMELVEGQPLHELLPPQGFPIRQALGYIAAVIDGLSYAHSHGIVHRDLKPANVMVSKTGQVKLMDFGMARSSQVKTLTALGTVMGTPAYLAPEQVLNGPGRDSLTDRSDQYALAVMIYEILTGRKPFEEKFTMKLLMAHLEDPPPHIQEYNPSIPVEFGDALLKMLSKDPLERFESVKAAGQYLLKGYP